MKQYLILVDENDNEIGSMEKMLVHQLGRLHRAFSVFVFNERGDLLLQQRANDKYHSAGLWSNTCCSHPRYGENISEAVQRRLHEEMGLECTTQFEFSFTYRTEFENGLTEHEVDHVYFGFSAGPPAPRRSEVQNWKYISFTELEKDVNENPDAYTTWLKLCLPEVFSRWNKSFINHRQNF